MCLTSGRMATLQEFNEEREGWKVMHFVPSDTPNKIFFRSACGYDRKSDLYELNKWYSARVSREYFGLDMGQGEQLYPTGFHICKTKAVAIKWADNMCSLKDTWYLVRVKYVGTIIVGKDEGGDCDVAAQMCIEEYEKLEWARDNGRYHPMNKA